MKSTAKREVMTGVITFLVYGILGFAASVLTSLPEAGLDSLAASHAVFIIGSIASSAVLVGGIAFGIVFGKKRSNGYLIGLVASVVVPYIAYAAARIKASKRNKIKTV